MTVRRTARAKGGDLPVAESDAMTHRIVALGNRGPEILAIREEMCVGVEIGAGRSIGLRVFNLLVDGIGIDHDADGTSEMLLA